MIKNNIESIIKKKKADINFQPIISVKGKKIIGFEALGRGIDFDDSVISPINLFKFSEKKGVSVELDRMLREKAVRKFSSLNMQNEFMLSINFHTSIIDKGVVGSGAISKLISKYRIPQEKVIIEIVESKLKNQDDLKRFVDIYRNKGFMIAIDDFGLGCSNFERLNLIKPDIIKLDRSFIENIENDFMKQEAVRALTGFGHKIGSMIVAEGVETENEIISVLMAGVDLLQGYYFSVPVEIEKIDFTELREKVDRIAMLYICSCIKKNQRNMRRQKKYFSITDKCIEKIKSAELNYYGTILKKICVEEKELACVYVLNSSGIQLTETISVEQSKKYKNSLYSPAPKGADHSLKDYYIGIASGATAYSAQPNISLADGKICATYSQTFKSVTGQKLILCADFNIY